MLEWSRTSPNTTYRGGPKMGDVGRLSVAKCRGVWGRALLTWRGGGLGELNPWALMGASKWWGGTARSARGPWEAPIHFGGPIERTGHTHSPKTPHAAAMCARLAGDGLMSHGEAQGGPLQHAGPPANFSRACRDGIYIITTFAKNALTPRKLFYVSIFAPTRGFSGPSASVCL